MAFSVTMMATETPWISIKWCYAAGHEERAGGRGVAADAAQGQGPDRPGLQRGHRDRRARHRGGVLARALHPRLQGSVRRDTGTIPDAAADRAGLRTAQIR